MLDPGFTEPTYVTGYTVTADQRQEIHHAQIFHIDAAQAADGEQRSGKDGRPGWQCYGGPALQRWVHRGATGRGGNLGAARPRGTPRSARPA